MTDGAIGVGRARGPGGETRRSAPGFSGRRGLEIRGRLCRVTTGIGLRLSNLGQALRRGLGRRERLAFDVLVEFDRAQFVFR